METRDALLALLRADERLRLAVAAGDVLTAGLRLLELEREGRRFR